VRVVLEKIDEAGITDVGNIGYYTTCSRTAYKSANISYFYSVLFIDIFLLIYAADMPKTPPRRQRHHLLTINLKNLFMLVEKYFFLINFRCFPEKPRQTRKNSLWSYVDLFIKQFTEN